LFTYYTSVVRYKYILCAQKTANSSYSTTEPEVNTQWTVFLKPGVIMKETNDGTQSGLDSDQNV